MALYRGVAAAIQEGWVSNTCAVTVSDAGPTIGTGFSTYTVEIFGDGLQYNSIGLNGPTLMAEIGWSCGTNVISGYTFTRYEANGTTIVAHIHVFVNVHSRCYLPIFRQILSVNTCNIHLMAATHSGAYLGP